MKKRNFVIAIYEEHEKKDSFPKKIGRGVIRFLSWPVAGFLLLIIGVLLFVILGIGAQEVNRLMAAIPKQLVPLVAVAFGLGLGWMINALSKTLAKAIINALGIQEAS